MKTHAVIGAKMLAGSESSVLQMAQEIALCHHERWDGGGYPRGLAESAIPEAARIVALVDVYDALTHDRVYRAAMPETEALAIMEQGRGNHFDPFLFGVFLGLLPEMRRIAAENPDERVEEYRASEFATGADQHARGVRAGDGEYLINRRLLRELAKSWRALVEEEPDTPDAMAANRLLRRMLMARRNSE